MRLTIAADGAAHPFAYWDTGRAAWVIAPGSYGVRAGSSSGNLPLSASVRLTR